MNLRLRRNYVIAVISALTLLVSCDKDDAAAASEQEKAAADAIINAMSPESGGAITQTDEAVAKASTVSTEGKNLDEPPYDCGVTYSDSVESSGGQGSVTYSISADWQWVVNCTQFSIPESFEMGFYNNRQYASTRMASDDTGEGSITVTGIEVLSDAYVVNASAAYNGSQVSYIGNNNALTSNINFTVVNLTYDKDTLEITSGTVTVALSGTFNGEESLTYGGTIEFLGNHEAVLHMNNGSTYEFSW